MVWNNYEPRVLRNGDDRRNAEEPEMECFDDDTTEDTTLTDIWEFLVDINEVLLEVREGLRELRSQNGLVAEEPEKKKPKLQRQDAFNGFPTTLWRKNPATATSGAWVNKTKTTRSTPMAVEGSTGC